MSQTSTKTSLRPKEDYQLIRLAIDGDQKAFEQLMKKYKNAVFHQMLKMVNNPEDAEDLTIEAFGKAFNKLESYVPKYAFSTWLFTIAINNCIDSLRKKRISTLSIDRPVKEGSPEDFANLIRDTNNTPEEIILKNQRKELMRKLVEKLSEKYRFMIELRFFQELSYDEIAKELDIPLGTVKAQLFRAKQILYSYLKTPAAQAYLNNN